MELKEICEQRYSGLLLFLDDFGYDFKHRIILKSSVIEFLKTALIYKLIIFQLTEYLFALSITRKW